LYRAWGLAHIDGHRGHAGGLESGGGEMNDGIGPHLRDQAFYCFGIADVRLVEVDWSSLPDGLEVADLQRWIIEIVQIVDN
jgi:hypothetical protein